MSKLVSSTHTAMGPSMALDAVPVLQWGKQGEQRRAQAICLSEPQYMWNKICGKIFRNAQQLCWPLGSSVLKFARNACGVGHWNHNHSYCMAAISNPCFSSLFLNISLHTSQFS